jgi:hypothetical protein
MKFKEGDKVVVVGYSKEIFTVHKAGKFGNSIEVWVIDSKGKKSWDYEDQFELVEVYNSPLYKTLTEEN